MAIVDYFSYPFLALAVLVGLLASFSDLKEGRIKNRLLVYGALVALYFYLAEILILLSFNASVSWSYFRDVLVNAVLGFLAGFILWHFNIWAAGDAKLFAFFVFSIPLVYYQKNYLPYFPSFALILNIFIVILAFIFLKMIFDVFLSAVLFLASKRSVFAFGSNSSNVPVLSVASESRAVSAFGSDRPDEIRKIKLGRGLDVKKIFKEFLFMPVFAFGIFISLTMVFKSLQAWGKLGELAFLSHPVFLFLSMFILFQVLNKMTRPLKMGLAFSFLIYLAVGLRLWPAVISTAFFDAFQLQTLYFIFGFLILNKLIDFYIEKKDVSRIPLDKLKPQMVLARESLQKLRELSPDLAVDSDGLTEEDVGIIKDLGEKNSELRFVEIYKAIPLAPFIFLGVILTLILKGTLISLML